MPRTLPAVSLYTGHHHAASIKSNANSTMKHFTRL